MASRELGRWASLGRALLVVLALTSSEALALITGGTGNEPISSNGWPVGAGEVFNHVARVAWWEGPPLGGGQWHAECRGDAETLNQVLVDFAQIDSPRKRLVVRDGVGHSFWLNPNRDPARDADARVDWVFSVWQRENLERRGQMLPMLRGPDDPNLGVPTITAYAGGAIRWSDVKVPEGIEVDDQRLEAHGYTAADGVVFEGTLVDLADSRPLRAEIRLEAVEPAPEGGYRNTERMATQTDENGRWVLRQVPASQSAYRLVATAEGYAPLLIDHVMATDQPSWSGFSTGLARAVEVSGRVVDEEGRPLAEVNVRLDDVQASSEGGLYSMAASNEAVTDAEGRFKLSQLPGGTGRLWVHKPGYSRSGLGESVTLPSEDVQLSMQRAARLKVVFEFARNLPEGSYIVRVVPEGGERVGSWGGSAQLDAEGTFVFNDVPPGRYLVSGRPNPGSDDEETAPVEVDLVGGTVTELRRYSPIAYAVKSSKIEE